MNPIALALLKIPVGVAGAVGLVYVLDKTERGLKRVGRGIKNATQPYTQTMAEGYRTSKAKWS